MKKIFWIDLETTGLDPARDKILEVAVAESSFGFPFHVKPLYHAVVRANVDLERLDPIVREMHSRNGLLAECADAKLSKPFETIDLDLRSLVPILRDPEEKPILAGSSVHFDRAFLLAACGPAFVNRFSHRLYDISAVSLFLRSIGMPKVTTKSDKHRAKADVLASVLQAEACYRWVVDPNNPLVNPLELVQSQAVQR